MYLTKFVTTPHTPHSCVFLHFSFIQHNYALVSTSNFLYSRKCHIRAYACLGQTYFAQPYHFKLNTTAYSFNQINLSYKIIMYQNSSDARCTPAQNSSYNLSLT